MDHRISRIRHEIKRRRLEVAAVELVTPAMLRVELVGEDLADFASAGSDDHVKLFVPDGAEMARRDYTPRRFDAAARRLVLDFALHEAGPATHWALAARPGDAVEVAGPRGSMVVAWEFDWFLLVGDETALPAIGRRIEEAPAGTRILAVVAVTGAAEEQRFETRADVKIRWVHRAAARADDPAPVLAALAGVVLPPGEGFVWAAAEAGVARAVRAEILGRGHPAGRARFAAYWLRGEADASVKLED